MNSPAPVPVSLALMKEILGRIAAGHTMSEDQAEEVFEVIMSGDATPAQIGGLLMALRVRGETVEEITGAARIMRSKALPVEAPEGAIDTCGTGGDGSGTYNISTAAAFVVAGAGVPVAKHGNRALSSKSGSADVLTALGIKIDADMALVKESLWDNKIGFLMAPRHHNAMRHVAGPRVELGTRTIFNLLGPLTNPAGAKRQVLGVFADRWVEPLARVLGALGAERAWVVHGGGMDEMTITGETSVAEWRDGQVRLFTITPEAVGLPRGALADITGGSPVENALALRDMLGGKTGAYRDIVLLNAAAAFLMGDRVETLREGVELAAKVIDDGSALAALDTLARITSAPR